MPPSAPAHDPHASDERPLYNGSRPYASRAAIRCVGMALDRIMNAIFTRCGWLWLRCIALRGSPCGSPCAAGHTAAYTHHARSWTELEDRANTVLALVRELADLEDGHLDNLRGADDAQGHNAFLITMGPRLRGHWRAPDSSAYVPPALTGVRSRDWGRGVLLAALRGR